MGRRAGAGLQGGGAWRGIESDDWLERGSGWDHGVGDL